MRGTLVVALMILGWCVRGQFGHLKGAMIPGALAALAWGLYQTPLPKKPALGRVLAFAAVGFGLGGHLGYGDLIEKAIAAVSFSDFLPFVLRLGIIGAIWGGLGMTFLGFGASEKPIGTFGYTLLLALCLLWGIILGILNMEYLDRVLFSVGLIVLHVYNTVSLKSEMIATLGITGILGFGLGFLLSVSLLWLGTQGLLPGQWWMLRDQIIGLLGGLALVVGFSFGSNQVSTRPNTLEQAFGKIGMLLLVFGLPFVNGYNVFHHWFIHDVPVLEIGAWISVGVVTMIFAVRAIFFSQSNGRFALGVIAILWLLSWLAVMKETLPVGWARWEPGFNIIGLCVVVVSLLLPRVYTER